MCKFSLLVCACIAMASTESVPAEQAQKTCTVIEEKATEAGFDPVLIAGVAWRESRFKPHAIGKGGELGVLQVKPRFVSGEHGPFIPHELTKLEKGVEAGLLMMKRWRVFANAQGLDGDYWLACYAAGVSCDRIASARLALYYRRVLLKYMGVEKQRRAARSGAQQDKNKEKG